MGGEGPQGQGAGASGGGEAPRQAKATRSLPSSRGVRRHCCWGGRSQTESSRGPAAAGANRRRPCQAACPGSPPPHHSVLGPCGPLRMVGVSPRGVPQSEGRPGTEAAQQSGGTASRRWATAKRAGSCPFGARLPSQLSTERDAMRSLRQLGGTVGVGEAGSRAGSARSSAARAAWPSVCAAGSRGAVGTMRVGGGGAAGGAAAAAAGGGSVAAIVTPSGGGGSHSAGAMPPLA